MLKPNSSLVMNTFSSSLQNMHSAFESFFWNSFGQQIRQKQKMMKRKQNNKGINVIEQSRYKPDRKFGPFLQENFNPILHGDDYAIDKKEGTIKPWNWAVTFNFEAYYMKKSTCKKSRQNRRHSFKRTWFWLLEIERTFYPTPCNIARINSNESKNGDLRQLDRKRDLSASGRKPNCIFWPRIR